MARLRRHDPGFASAQVAIPVDVESPHVFRVAEAHLWGLFQRAQVAVWDANSQLAARYPLSASQLTSLTAQDYRWLVAVVCSGCRCRLHPLNHLPHCGWILLRSGASTRGYSDTPAPLSSARSVEVPAGRSPCGCHQEFGSGSPSDCSLPAPSLGVVERGLPCSRALPTSLSLSARVKAGGRGMRRRSRWSSAYISQVVGDDQVVDAQETMLGSGRFANDQVGHAAMRRYAKVWPEPSGRSRAPTACPAAGAAAAGGWVACRDVSAKLAAWALLFDIAQPQTDADDVHSIAVSAVRTRVVGCRWTLSWRRCACSLIAARH